MYRFNKELFEQVRAEKKKEYDTIYNSLYKKILIGLCFVIMCAINILKLEDEIIAYVIGVIIIVGFDLIWKIKKGNK